VFGDAARLQALQSAGLARARAVVVTYLDVAGALKVLSHVQAHAPSVPVIVRTQDDLELEKLQLAGATEVVPESIEGSLMLASHALALVGVPMRRVIRIVQEQRDARYKLLRGYFHGADDHFIDESNQERLFNINLAPGSFAIGKRPAELLALTTEVRWINIRHHSGRNISPTDNHVIESGDILVLSGKLDSLVRAEAHLMRG